MAREFNLPAYHPHIKEVHKIPELRTGLWKRFIFEDTIRQESFDIEAKRFNVITEKLHGIQMILDSHSMMDLNRSGYEKYSLKKTLGQTMNLYGESKDKPKKKTEAEYQKMKSDLLSKLHRYKLNENGNTE